MGALESCGVLQHRTGVEEWQRGRMRCGRPRWVSHFGGWVLTINTMVDENLLDATFHEFLVQSVNSNRWDLLVKSVNRD